MRHQGFLSTKYHTLWIYVRDLAPLQGERDVDVYVFVSQVNEKGKNVAVPEIGPLAVNFGKGFVARKKAEKFARQTANDAIENLLAETVIVDIQGKRKKEFYQAEFASPMMREVDASFAEPDFSAVPNRKR